MLCPPSLIPEYKKNSPNYFTTLREKVWVKHTSLSESGTMLYMFNETFSNDSICISITFMDQSVSLNRETIIKESDVYIGYHSVEKKCISFCRP